MLSLIIPTLNEEERLPQTLRRARQVLEPGDELLVVDGGSRDGTCNVAARHGARVVHSRRGRGTQLNRGAGAAGGDVLWFVHADTLLPPDAGVHLRRALADPDVLGGNFLLLFDRPGWIARLFATVYNARSRRQRLFYGDSALWVRREVFEAVSGFPEAALMEDWAFCLSLRAEAGYRHPDLPLAQVLPLLDAPVVTSARRFDAGPGRALQMIAVWSLLHVLYLCGVPPESLESRFYRPPVS